MLMVIPNFGKQKWLNWALVSDGSDMSDYTLMLFQNDITIADATILSDLVEADFTGYSSVDILRTNMSAPFFDGDVAVSECDFVPTYSCTGGSLQTIYGWGLVSLDDMTLLAGQNFDFPRDMAPGATEKIDPFQIRLKTYV